MPVFKLNKLVRDKIPEDQVRLGQKPQIHTLTPKELRKALIEKLQEESAELQRSSTENLTKELADVQQVIDDLAKLENITKTEIKNTQKLRAARMGTFSKGLYVSNLETAEDDSWTDYYRQEPDRFPEVG